MKIDYTIKMPNNVFLMPHHNIMEFTKEIVIDCYQQAKVDNPKTNDEIDYNKLLDDKIQEENGN